jgi:hypothetical protein
MNRTDQDQRGTWFFRALLLLFAVVSLHAQPAAPHRVPDLDGTHAGVVLPSGRLTNRAVKDAAAGTRQGQLIGNAKAVEATVLDNVLDLDGTNSAVQLPPNIFTNLDQATIEAWIKFRDLSGSRFYSYGGFQQDICLGRRSPPHTGRDLTVFINQSGQLDEVVVSGILQTGDWYHVALVLGRGGMELHVNGMLAGTNASPASFANLRSGELHSLGRMNGSGPDALPVYFNDQLKEFRVWKTRRTPQEIRENMFKDLTGAEPDLAGLWSFRDGTAKDFSTNAHHGTFQGGAMVIQSLPPPASQLMLPGVLSGTITDNQGNAMTNATVRLWRGEQQIATTPSRRDGTYSLALRRELAEGTFDIQTEVGDLGAWVSGVVCPGGGERKGVNVTLANAESIVGKLMAFDGSTIENVIVQAVRQFALAVLECPLDKIPLLLPARRSNTPTLHRAVGNARVEAISRSSSDVEDPGGSWVKIGFAAYGVGRLCAQHLRHYRFTPHAPLPKQHFSSLSSGTF